MKSLVERIIINISRLVVACTLIVSGFVKAIDPLGTQYKIHDYLSAAHLLYIPQWIELGVAVCLPALEFCLGVFLLFAIRRRLVSRLIVTFMLLMTAITLWVYWADPVKDCGCFGDAIHLTNEQTFYKNLVLLLMSVAIAVFPLKMPRFVSRSNQWIVINYTIIYIIIVSAGCLYRLPLIDFRPYRVGTNILKAMEIPEDAPKPEFKTTFLLRKDGVVKEFDLEHYPDSTWEFVDSKTVTIKEGYVPPIHDFSIECNGNDITEEVLRHDGYTMWLISPSLNVADDSNFGDIDALYEYAVAHKIPFYCLTASNENGIRRWQDLTGAEYPFCITDETTLKTMIRSNPGLILLRNGTIVGKWSHNDLPVAAVKENIDQLAAEQQAEHSLVRILLKVFLYFCLPLLVLSIADRLWAWSTKVRAMEKKQLDRIKLKN